jgi:uncharacterized repeat protein (TIGR01451 family)
VATLSVDTPHAKVGDGLVYRVTVSDKAGSGGASGVKVAITLPAGMSVTSTYTDRGPGCTVTGTQLLCDVAWISPGVDAHLIIRATAASAGSLITTAVAREEEPDAALADNTSTATVVIDGTSQQVQSAGPTRLGIQLVGKAKVGQTLRTSYWTLAGMTATRPGYSWQLCEAHSCRVIAGEHRASLVVRRAFVGYTLRAVISATVGTQICSATSAATARVR